MVSAPDAPAIKPGQGLRVQFLSRDLPDETAYGSGAYVLDFLTYLHQAGCAVEFVVVEPVSGAGSLPWTRLRRSLLDVAEVCSSNGRVVGETLVRPLRRWIKAPFWLVYQWLPEPVKNTYRRLRPPRPLPPNAPRRSTLMNTARVVPANDRETAYAREQFRRFRPDVVIVNYVWLANLLDAVPPDLPALRVILTVDVLHSRLGEFKRLGLDAGLLDWTRESETVELRRGQVVLAIQQADAAMFREMAPDREVLCLPMAAPLRRAVGPQVPGRCLFVGSNADHNVDGLRWFLRHVWPGVLAAAPESTLHVCGNVNEIVSGSYPRVKFLGPVPDLAPEYSAAEVCLVPLRVGSGLKIKLVEALSYGRACVSTTAGLHGLADLNGQAALAADEPADFAAAVVAFTSDAERRRACEANALRYVAEHLSAEVVYKPFLDRILAHKCRQGS